MCERSTSIIYIHRLRIVDVNDRKALRLLGREEAEADFLDLTRHSARVGNVLVRHDCGSILETIFDGIRRLFDDRKPATMATDEVWEDLRPRRARPTPEAALFANLDDFDPKLLNCVLHAGNEGISRSRDVEEMVWK